MSHAVNLYLVSQIIHEYFLPFPNLRLRLLSLVIIFLKLITYFSTLSCIQRFQCLCQATSQCILLSCLYTICLLSTERIEQNERYKRRSKYTIYMNFITVPIFINQNKL